MLPIYLTLFTVVLYSFASIIRKKISAVDEKFNYIYCVLFQLTGGISVFIFSLLLGFGNEYSGYVTHITPYVAIKIIIGAILWFSATVTSFQALNTISASKYSVIETLSPLISIVLALLFLSESFTQQQFVGMVLILLSVFAVVYDKETKFSHFSKGEFIALVSALLSGTAIVNDKGIFLATPLSPSLTLMFILPGLFGIIARPAELKKIKTVVKNKKIMTQLLIMSVIWGIAAISYYKAIVISNSVSLIVSISQISVILTVILGLIFLKEIENWKIKIAASIISVLGLILMSVSF